MKSHKNTDKYVKMASKSDRVLGNILTLLYYENGGPLFENTLIVRVSNQNFFSKLGKVMELHFIFKA